MCRQLNNAGKWFLFSILKTNCIVKSIIRQKSINAAKKKKKEKETKTITKIVTRKIPRKNENGKRDLIMSKQRKKCVHI